MVGEHKKIAFSCVHIGTKTPAGNGDTGVTFVYCFWESPKGWPT